MNGKELLVWVFQTKGVILQGKDDAVIFEKYRSPYFLSHITIGLTGRRVVCGDPRRGPC